MVSLHFRNSSLSATADFDVVPCSGRGRLSQLSGSQRGDGVSAGHSAALRRLQETGVSTRS